MDNNTSTVKEITSEKYIEQHEIEKNVGEMINSLLHERNNHPFVYMAKYLSQFVSKEELRKHKISIPGPAPLGRPIVKFPKLNEMSTCLLAKYLTKETWHLIKHKKTKYGANINNLTKLHDNSPNDPIGCIIIDGDCLNAFDLLLYPIISDFHGIKVNELSSFNNFSYDLIEEENVSDECQNVWTRKVLNVIISFSRNVFDYPFNQCLSNDMREEIKNYLIAEITELIENKLIPEFTMLTYEQHQYECDSLLKMIKFNEDWMTRANLKQNWPDHRVIFKTERNDIVILINFIDHLRIYGYNKKPHIDIVRTYNQLIQIVKQLDFNVSFETQKGIGFITTDIKEIGTGFVVSSEIVLNNLQKKDYFLDLIKGLKYDLFSFLPNSESISLTTLKMCKLNNLSQLSFFKEYYNTLIGLIALDNDNNLELSLENITFPSYSSKEINANVEHHYLYPLIKQIYTDHYPSFKYEISRKGNNINNLLSYYLNHPNKDFILLLNDQSEYDSFSEFIYHFILNTQLFDIKKYDHIHQPEGKNKVISIPSEECFILISDISVCIRRNVKNYPFPHYHKNQNEEIEELFIKAINELKANGESIEYHPFTSETMKLLSTKYNYVHLFHRDEMIKYNVDTDYLNYRGLITFSAYDNICGVINDGDHFKLFLNLETTTPKEFDQLFFNLLEFTNLFSRHINFKYDMKLGFLTSNPEYLGTGLSLKINLFFYSIPYEKIVSFLKHKEFNCSLISSNKAGYLICLFNRVTIGFSETELYSCFLTYISELIQLDNSYLK